MEIPVFEVIFLLSVMLSLLFLQAMVLKLALTQVSTGLEVFLSEFQLF